MGRVMDRQLVGIEGIQVVLEGDVEGLELIALPLQPGDAIFSGRFAVPQ